MLDGPSPTLIATPSRSDKSIHHWWSRCSNGIRLTCVVGSAPLMSMMRKLWRPSVASSWPTTKTKFPNNDIDSIHLTATNTIDVTMQYQLIAPYRHAAVAMATKQILIAGLHAVDPTVRYGAAFHAPNLTIDGPVHILSIWSFTARDQVPVPDRHTFNPITMRWGGNVYAAAIIRHPTPQRAIITASHKHTLRWGHQTAHVNNWRN